MHELLLTFVFRWRAAQHCDVYPFAMSHVCPRTDRWLRNFNIPLVNALSEHESILDELAVAQELRVQSANEVLSRMRLTAGTGNACCHVVPCLSVAPNPRLQSLLVQAAMRSWWSARKCTVRIRPCPCSVSLTQVFNDLTLRCRRLVPELTGTAQ
jgi:hypothetical protein